MSEKENTENVNDVPFCVQAEARGMLRVFHYDPVDAQKAYQNEITKKRNTRRALEEQEKRYQGAIEELRNLQAIEAGDLDVTLPEGWRLGLVTRFAWPQNGGHATRRISYIHGAKGYVLSREARIPYGRTTPPWPGNKPEWQWSRTATTGKKAFAHSQGTVQAYALDIMRAINDGNPPDHQEEEPAPFDEGPTREVLSDIEEERRRQHEKWGQQDWPFVNEQAEAPFSMNRRRDRLDQYLISKPETWREWCKKARQQGTLTYWPILMEEVAEAVEVADDLEACREEMVQVAAVAVQMIEAIDRKLRNNE